MSAIETEVSEMHIQFFFYYQKFLEIGFTMKER